MWWNYETRCCKLIVRPDFFLFTAEPIMILHYSDFYFSVSALIINLLTQGNYIIIFRSFLN